MPTDPLPFEAPILAAISAEPGVWSVSSLAFDLSISFDLAKATITLLIEAGRVERISRRLFLAGAPLVLPEKPPVPTIPHDTLAPPPPVPLTPRRAQVRIGVGGLVDRVLAAVRQNPGATAREIARSVGVSRTQIPEIVLTLTARGYLRRVYAKRNAGGYLGILYYPADCTDEPPAVAADPPDPRWARLAELAEEHDALLRICAREGIPSNEHGRRLPLVERIERLARRTATPTPDLTPLETT